MTRLSFVCFILGVLIAVAGATDRRVILNKAIDVVMRVAAKNLAQNGKDEILLPPIDEEFKKGWSFLSVKGSFKAEGGRLGHMTSMRRTGNVTLIMDDSSVTLNAELGLADLGLVFQKYQAKFGIIKVSGLVNLTIPDNSLKLTVALLYDDPDCTAQARKVGVDRLDGINVQLTGMWKFNWLYSKIVTWIINRSKGQIISTINEKALESVKEALNKYDLCEELREYIF